MIGTPSTPDAPATSDALMFYSRIRNGIATAEHEHQKRIDERHKSS